MPSTNKSGGAKKKKKTFKLASFFIDMGSIPFGCNWTLARHAQRRLDELHTKTARVYIIPRDIHPFLQPACWHSI